MLDIATFVAFLVAMDPRTSGIAIHEWLTLALAATIVVHLLMNWSWIVEVSKRFFKPNMNGRRINYILNWLLFLDGIAVMLSGIMISEAAMPALGLSIPVGFGWHGLHELSTNLALLILGVHLAMHWNWIVSTVKRMFSSEKIRPVSSTMLAKKDGEA